MEIIISKFPQKSIKFFFRKNKQKNLTQINDKIILLITFISKTDNHNSESFCESREFHFNNDIKREKKKVSSSHQLSGKINEFLIVLNLPLILNDYVRVDVVVMNK